MDVRRSLKVLMAGMLAAGLFGGGCSGSSRLDSVDAGRTFHYVQGLPNFDLEAVATARDGQAGIDLYLSIPHASLVFLPVENGYQARFETLVRVLNRKGKTLVAEYAGLDTVRVPTYEVTKTFAPFIKEQRLSVAPDAYLIEVTLIDAESRKEARRRQRVEVVAVGAAQPVLSRIRLEGKPPRVAFAPILSLHLPAGLDSFRTAVELYNAHHLGEAEVTMRLLRFPSDTAAARPPSGFTAGQGFGLIRYNRADTLQITRRRLRDLDREIVIEFDLPAPGEGLYRVEVQTIRTTNAASAEQPLLYRRRDFAVRSASFPQITTLDEMVEALVYVARRQELDHIRAAETTEEKKRRFDAFWGALIPEASRAANLLKLYYSRVEEANLLYTTYKEGWKTDRGMVYILFGSPLYVDTQLEYEVWRYSYDEYDNIGSFAFTRRRLYASGGLFEAYLLNRDPSYEAGWRRALRRWRRGEVL